MSLRRITVADGFVAACAVAVCVLAALPERWLVDAFVLDDALYYPRVAMNIVAGRGPTYDGRVWTNGVHPLWQALLVPVAAVAGGDPSRMLRLSFVLSAALVIVAVVSLRDLGLRLGWGGIGVVVAAAMLVITRVDLWMSLMESGPSMALLLVAMAAMAKWDLLASDRRAHVVGLGVLLSWVFLVRLDFVFLCAAWLATAVGLRRVRGQPWVQALRGPFLSGVVLTLVVSPYLLANQLGFGSIMPVSGRRKQVVADSLQDVWMAVMTPVTSVGNKLGLPPTAVLVLAVVGLLVGVIATRPRPGAVSPRFVDGAVLPGFVIGAVIRFLYLRTFMAYEASIVPWYWVPETVLVCLLCGWLASRALSRWGEFLPAPLRSEVAGGLAALALVALGVRYVVRDAEGTREDRQPYYDVASWIVEHGGPTARVAMVDSGMISWYTRCDTVSLNGLIGDEELMALANDGQYTAMARLHGADFLVYWVPPDQYAAIPPGAVLYEAPTIALDGSGQRLAVFDLSVYSPFPR